MLNLKTKWVRFWKDEEGIGTLEMIMIVAVVLILAVAFRKWIIGWFQELLNDSNAEINRTTTDQVTVPTPAPSTP
jgi:Flp pilus assembly pilin Flp